MKETVKIFKALGDPTRLRMVKMLEGGELCVCQLTAALGMGQSRISRHLAILKDCELIEDRRHGKWVHYRLSHPDAAEYAGELFAALDGENTVRADRQAARKAKRVHACQGQANRAR